MGFPSRLSSLWRNLARRASVDRDLDDELRAALDVVIDEKRRSGLSREAARRAAMLEFGGIESVKERVRDARTGSALNGWASDIRFALRLMTRHPAFTAIAVLTLAAGIGANAAIFTLVDAVLLRRLPVTQPEQLVALDVVTDRGRRQNLSYVLFERLRQETHSFSGMCAALDGVIRMEMVAADAGAPEEIQVQLVSHEYFEVLGVRPHTGRFLSASKDRDPDNLAVLSHDFWSTRFGADPRIVGRSVIVKQQPLTIVGVAPPGFFGESVGRAPDVWTPLTMQPRFDRGRSLLDQANVGWLNVVARREPGVTGSQVEADLALFGDSLRASPPAGLDRYVRSITIQHVDASQGLPEFRDRFALSLRVLAGIVGLVLLVACANVANLLLGRVATRRQEMAVRLALGAGRSRLLRQLLTESVVLAAAGAAVGLLVAWGGSRVLVALASNGPDVIPIDVSPNIRVLAFTAAVSLATVALFGVGPALIGSRLAVSNALKAGARTISGGRLARGLVVAQIAMSLVLLAGAGLFVQTLRNLLTRDVGYETRELVEVRVAAEASGYQPDQLLPLARRISERLGGVAGVESVSVAQAGFGSGISTTCCIAVEGYRHLAAEDRMMRTLAVAPGYFRTLRLRLARGRDFTAAESAHLPRAPVTSAIVNEAFVRRYLHEREPIGARFGWGDPPNVRYDLTIVGVARNAVHDGLRDEARPLIYFPSLVGNTFVVRTAVPVEAVVPAIRQAMRDVDRRLEMQLRTVTEAVNESLVRERLLSRLSSACGVLAVLLAAIGLYGLTSCAVVARTREIGTRMALGAERGGVLREELLRAGRVVAMGLVIGVPAAIAASDVIRTQLFGVSATDPVMLGVVTMMLVLVAAAAAYAPARRASHVDPIVALRYE
jgi:predicted permease